MQADLSPETYSLTDAATIAVGYYPSGATLTVTLGGNRTLGAPSGAFKDGHKLLFRLVQDATGSRTLALATGTGGYAFGTDITAITLTTTASKIDYLGVVYNAAANKWHVIAFAKGY